MEIFDDPLRAAIYYTGMLLRQLCIVTTLAFVVFRLRALRRAVTDENPRWFHRLLLIILLSAVAVIDDRMGTVFDVDTGRPVERTDFFKPLERGQAILDLRDLVVIFGGLAGGVWIGLGAGLIAGINRYLLGSHVGLAAAVGTVVLGLFGAILHHGFPKLSRLPLQAMAVGAGATLIQRLIIYWLTEPVAGADFVWQLTLIILLPKLATNVFGCGLFAFILRTVENDRQVLRAKETARRAAQQELSARRIEILALRAQIEPHFLHNTLTNIQALTYSDPIRARVSIGELAQYFRETRAFVKAELISLKDELGHTLKYLGFWKSRFGENFQYPEDLLQTLEPPLLAWGIPPFSVQVLAENACNHGFRPSQPFELSLAVRDSGDRLTITVADDGCGIPANKLPKLGKGKVGSVGDGTGTALFHLSEMLHLTLGPEAELRIASEEGKGTTATLTLPKRRTT